MPPKSRFGTGRLTAPRHGRMTEERWAWIRTIMGQMAIYVYDENSKDRPENSEPGDDVTLMIPRPGGGKPLTLNFTSMTHQELQLVREFFTVLFDTVEPITIARDKAAEDAWSQGDDAFARSYRQVPQLVIRKRKVPADDSSVLERPEGDAGGSGDEGDPDGGVRGSGDGVASEESQHREPEDDGTSSDEPEGVRPLG